jgi:hypothetical protein
MDVMDELEKKGASHAFAPKSKPDCYVDIGHFVDSYRFWDLVQLWAQETLRHHSLIARALAKAVLCDGLRLQSHIPSHIANDPSIRWGKDIVGYVSTPGSPLVLLRISALHHLEAIVERAALPDPYRLHEEFVLKTDFQHWLLAQGLPLPTFWFSPVERSQAANA